MAVPLARTLALALARALALAFGVRFACALLLAAPGSEYASETIGRMTQASVDAVDKRLCGGVFHSRLEVRDRNFRYPEGSLGQ